MAKIERESDVAQIDELSPPSNELRRRGKNSGLMDRMREETRQRIGTVDVAVDLIREVRDR